jgi:hypothetical protein
LPLKTALCIQYGYADLARYRIPKTVGEVEIISSKIGTPLITNHTNGKNKILIPCRDWEHAEEVLRKIKSLKKGGDVWA